MRKDDLVRSVDFSNSLLTCIDLFQHNKKDCHLRRDFTKFFFCFVIRFSKLKIKSNIRLTHFVTWWIDTFVRKLEFLLFENLISVSRHDSIVSPFWNENFSMWYFKTDHLIKIPKLLFLMQKILYTKTA